MTIQTDSTPLESPKDYESCNVFKIIKLIAENDHIDEIKNKYKAGGYGYGHAKTDLFELILSKYKNERDKYNHLMSNKKEIDNVLLDGASRAKATANEVLSRVKTKLGY